MALLMALVAVAAHAEAAAPRLLVTTLVDRLVVEPGGRVAYAVRVDNVGDAETTHVRVTAHLPPHTRADSEHCPEGTVEPDGDVCVQPDVPTPGVGDEAHQVVHSRSPLGAGDGFTLRFGVRVDDDAPIGTHLRNHAHAAIALTGAEVTTAPVDTLVVDRVPRAAAADGSVSLSGNLVTDSFDSSLGPYEQTRSASGGNVAGNGDIHLSGTVVVNGDATPGPGHATTVDGSARVTGSTAPAPSAFTLNAVDATAYATRNANELLCAAPGSCDDATYSASTQVLTVAGAAFVRPGAYYLCRLEVKGRLIIEGPVTFWLGPPEACPAGGDARFSSAASVETGSGLPVDFHLRLQGSSAAGSVVETSQAVFRGVVYAPASRLAVGGGAQLFGGATAAILTGSGSGALHLDRSLHDPGAAP